MSGSQMSCHLKNHRCFPRDGSLTSRRPSTRRMAHGSALLRADWLRFQQTALPKSHWLKNWSARRHNSAPRILPNH
jgi:hypothetical protein